MASSGFAAKGTTFLWNGYPVLELTNISGPGNSTSDVDITNHDSPGDYKEYTPSFLDAGEFSIEGNFVPGDTNGQVALKSDFQSRTSRTGKVIFPGGRGEFTFTAYPKAYNVTAPVEGKASVTVAFRVTGATDLDAASAAAGLTTPFFALRDNSANAVTPSPAAANAVYDYTATLDAADTAVAVQPTAAAGTIKVNGATVVSGAWSSDVSVAAGGSVMLLIVVSETDKASKIYRIHVSRPSS